MYNINLLEELFDQKMLRILRMFIANKDNQFYLREISKQCKVPVATTSRIIDKLLKLSLIKIIKIKKFKLYQLHTDNSNIRYLESFLREEKRILDFFLDAIKSMNGIISVIQHGEVLKDRANILVIGEGIDAAELKRIVAEIKEKYKFTISYLVLTEIQFRQMSTMGLYSGKKKVIFGGK